MKNLLIAITFCSFTFASMAQLNTQNLLSTAGDYFETETVLLAWSLGEIATETLTGSNIILTQGFQQSKLNAVGIDETHTQTSNGITVYPNPSNGIANLVIDNYATNGNDMPNRYLIYDIQGKLLVNEPILGSKTVIDLKQFSGSVYYIKLLNTETLWFKSLVIQKQN